MSKYVHIVIGCSARGCLNAYLSENKDDKYFGEIYNFNDDLSTGSIYNLDENLKVRVDWFEKMANLAGENLSDKEVLKEVELIYSNELNVPKDADIIIWAGNNVIEQTALSYIVSKFKERTLYEVNVSDFKVENKYGEKYFSKMTAECDPETLGKLLKNICLINDNKKETLVLQWADLKKEKNILRVFNEGKITSVNENYYDDDILKLATNEYMLAAKIIGTVMGTTEQIIGDTYLHFRVIDLIEKNKLDYEGELNSLRSLKVKIK